MSVEYWYRSQLNNSFEDITKHIQIHASGNESINELPGQFKFKFEPYKNINGIATLSNIDINISDEILITDNQIDFIAYGKVFDPGRNLLTWDKKNNRAICEFNVSCIQSDFSSLPISKQEFTNTTFFEIVNFIMEYTDNSLGESIVGKYATSLDNFDIENYVIEKKTGREALTELCQNYDLFWSMQHTIKPDATKKYIIERYIQIDSSTGWSPNAQDWAWFGGINNEHVRKGTISNPVTTNLSLTPIIPAEQNFKIQTDASVMLNYIELNAKVYESSTILYRYDHPAEPDKFEYELDGYSADVIYVAQWTKDKVTVQSGSTSSVLKLQSRYAEGIEVGNVAYFKSHPNEFFIVESVNQIDLLITNLSFTDNLTFSPIEGEEFEIVGNIPIYRKESEINYSSKGCIIDTDKKNYTKVKFLDLSEPNSSQNIIFFYKRIKDLPFKLKNDESIQKYGLRYREIKLDDDLILTEEELQNLISKLLILKPQYKFSFTTKRYGLAPIGMLLPIKIDNFITDTFILNDMEWQHISNKDQNKKSMFLQNLNFSTYIGKPEKIIERFRRQKKLTSTSVNDKEKNIQIEKIKTLEIISWNFGINPPVLTTFEFIDETTLIINWVSYANALGFAIDLSLFSDFSTILVSSIVDTGGSNLASFVGNYIENNSVFYARIKVRTVLGISNWSQPLEISKVTLAEKIIYCELAGTGNYRLVKANNDNTSKTYLTPDSYTSIHPRASHDGTKIVFIKEYSASKSDLMILDLVTNTITNLTNFATNNNYVWNPSFNNDDTKILYAYHAGSRSATAVIKEMTISTLSVATLYTASGTTDNISPEYNTDNTKLYFSNTSGLVLFDIATSGITIIDAGNEYFATQHPTQNKIIYSSSVGGINYKLVERDLGANTVADVYPAYSYNMFARYSPPDGNSVIWSSLETGIWQIKKKNLITNSIVDITANSIHSLYPEWANIVDN